MQHRMTVAGTALAVGLTTVLALTVHAARTPASAVAGLAPGKVELKSAGALAFGPDGVLFVGDSVGGAVVALETNDRATVRTAPNIDVQGLDQKIAALVGVMPDEILINDVAVNPASKNVYVSASRGRGPDAMPLVVRVDASGKLTPLTLDNIGHESVSLADAPAAAPGARQNPRTLTITDLAYVNGSVLVAGMSNEEWSSALRSIPYPFKMAAKGTQLQIWHASHGQYETQAPVRTFVPYTISGQSYILAAYTCTPLVKIPMSDLRPGAQVKGVTIADLGSGNQPLDMVPYKKDGHDYILIANTSFGVVKLHADDLGSYKPIDSPTVVNVAGAPYDTITALKDVQHLAQLDDARALVLTAKPGSGPAWAPGSPTGPVSLQTLALP
jgi:hypothetical protein